MDVNEAVLVVEVAFIEKVPKRYPVLDDKPFTSENCAPLLYFPEGEGEIDTYFNDCDCEICKKGGVA